MFYCLGVQDGRTDLHEAAGNGHVDVVKLLLSEGAAVNAVDKVTLIITLSCWQFESAFALAVHRVHCERSGCAVMGANEYG